MRTTETADSHCERLFERWTMFGSMRMLGIGLLTIAAVGGLAGTAAAHDGWHGRRVAAHRPICPPVVVEPCRPPVVVNPCPRPVFVPECERRVVWHHHDHWRPHCR